MDTPHDTIPDKGLTHAGIFHADDVFAAALLHILNPRIQIVRRNAVPTGYDGIVFDIGGGTFDHHQVDARMRANGVPYASFGLVWERYGSRLLCEEDVAAFDETFVQPIDLADNAGAISELARCVSDFNPRGAVSQDEYDRAFNKAISWAQGILERRLASFNFERSSRGIVRATMERGDGRTLVLDTFVPWESAVIGSGYKYVVYPSLRGGYNVQCVPEQGESRSPVLPFPSEWWGLSAAELRDVTGVCDVTFCHRSGYLAAAKSLGGALMLAQVSMRWGRDEDLLTSC